MKKVLIINDLPVTTKVAMQVNSTVFTTFKYEVSMLPTILYSTNLSFKEVASLNCHSFLKDSLEIFNKLDIKFDAIYLGYLADISNVSEIIKYLPNTKDIYFDPIMGDSNKYYKGIDDRYRDSIIPLIKEASLITPNLFETTRLLNTPYKDNYTESDIKDMLVKLNKLGAKKVIITGVKLNNLYGIYSYDGKFNFYGREEIKYYPHGTGDIFSSLVSSFLLDDYSLEKASKLSLDILYEIIKYNYNNDIDIKMGLKYENILSKLVNDVIN